VKNVSAIRAGLEHGGVLAGCSAGAMIMGERMPGFPGLKPAFGMLKDVVIMPHFNEIPKTMVNGLHLLVRDDLVLVGIEGNTALVVNGQDYRVIGSGGVVVWSAEKRRYIHGEKVTLE
jgi:cyanophycinase